MNSSLTPRQIYLDNAAAATLDPRMIDCMPAYFNNEFVNLLSILFFDQSVEGFVQKARDELTSGLNCLYDEMNFTYFDMESDILELRGIALPERKRRKVNHILISPPEHHTVRNTAKSYQSCFWSWDGNELLILMVIEVFACSSGSACRGGNPKPSNVLMSLPLEDCWGMDSFRVTPGSKTTRNNVKRFCDLLPRLIDRIWNTN
jgi:cysteine sulfinate desulfinase/cysteine desulfurase-like protein